MALAALWGRAYKSWGLFAPIAVLGNIIMVLIVTGATLFVTPRLHYAYKLEAVQDGSSLHGSFFLGSGSINDSPTFTYYQVQDGAYHLQSWPGYKAEVRYIAKGEVPHVEYNVRDDSMNSIFWPLPIKPWGASPNWDGRSAYATFYVPEGSIVNNYSLDAK